MATCYSCAAALPEKVFRNTLCESCGKDAKVCLNCEFYDPSAHWQCRETVPEAVREKDRANFCDYFRAASASTATGAQPTGTPDARDAFSRLFDDE